MSERIPCSNPDCKNTILPATAAANDGLCAPCVAAIAKKEHDEYVRLNRKTVDPYVGVTDLVKVAVIMFSPRERDELIEYASPPMTSEELFGALSEEQGQQLARLAGKALEEGRTDLAEDIGKSLATLTDFDLSNMLSAWVAKDHHWPSIVFRGANPKIRDSIIFSLNKGTANANHALCALAWIGDEVVQSAFQRWDFEKPSWASKLYILPSGYADTGGWHLSGGRRRELIHEPCYALTESTKECADSSVGTFRGASQTCPWCGHALSWMLDIDLADQRFHFLGFVGSRLRILTCHGCSCYGDGFFAKINPDGEAIPHPLAVRPKWLPDHAEPWCDPAWKNVPLSISPRRAIHAADWSMELKSSQIGGHPCWVQDAIYPKCPDCAEPMRFIGQLNEDDFPCCEGTYYAFLCNSCRTTATSYQQT